MHSPIPRDLTIYDDKFDFEKNGICPHQWEISVPQRSCIIWSVVLSYLQSADFNVPGKFEERLNRLTASAFNIESVKSAILGFNPFFNIHKCFFDETLQKVNVSFRKLLNESRPSTAANSVREDMQLISTLLKSNILIVDINNQELNLVTPSNGYYADVATITLICREYLSKDKKQIAMKRFTYSLDRDLCWALRRDALEIIVESTELRTIAEQEIQPLTDKKEKSVNMLLALLKKDLSREISELYDSPNNMSKLADAGFATDPILLDEKGLSAFYYALLSKDKNLIYLLHKYAVNNCCESDKTLRDIDSHVIANLLQLRQIIQDDRLRSQNFQYAGEKAEQALVRSEELQLYNEFLIKTCEGIQDIRTQHQDNPAEEATILKSVAFHILKVFDEFFTFGHTDSSFTESELLENYIKHKVYYDNLDSAVSLFFFDNSFLLKRYLSPPQLRLYLELESRFVLLIMAKKYFCTDIEDLVHKLETNATSAQNKILEFDVRDFYVFSLVERLLLRENVKIVCEILKEKDMAEEDIVECIEQQDISDILKDYPIVNDELLVARLHHYLTSALESKPFDSKQKFVLQRALQVIAESVQNETGKPSSIKFMLRSCLHSKTVSTLTQLKESLSNMKNFQFPIKFKIEKNDDLFKSIQSEIRKIKEAFEKVFDIQKVRFLKFLINRGLESVQKFQQPTVSKDNQMHFRPMENLTEVIRKRYAEFLIFRLDFYLRTALGTRGLKQDVMIHQILKAINEFIDFEKEYTGSISHLRHEGLSEDLLEVFIKSRITLSESFKSSLNFESDQDETIFRSFQCKILNFKNAFDVVYDTQRVWLMEFLTNQGLESDHQFQQFENFNVTSDDRRDVQKIILEFGGILDQKVPDRLPDYVPAIVELNMTLKGFASNKEKQRVLSEIPPEIKNRVDANRKLEQDIEGRIVVDLERFDSLFFIKRSDLCSIKNTYEKYLEEEEEPSKSSKRSSLLQKIRKTPNPFKILHLIFEKKKISDSQLDFLLETVPFSNASKDTLNTLIGISKDRCVDNLANLLNRIDQMYQITIEDVSDIKFFWERAKSTKAKESLVYKIVQRYLQESSFQASLEMLLFDCVAILKINKDFKSFWLKSLYLFKGIDWGNVLSHGDPLIESIGCILDPKDFPYELVQKMLQLIDDRVCIKALCELQRKVKQSDVISKFCSECKILKESIVSCQRWHGYCKLIAEDPLKDTTYNDIVSFLEKSFEAKWKKGKN